MAEIVPCPRCGKPMDYAVSIGYYCGPECIPKLTGRPLMADLPLSARLINEGFLTREGRSEMGMDETAELLLEAAAALDRTEALEQAAQAWAKAHKEFEELRANHSDLNDADDALLATIAALKG